MSNNPFSVEYATDVEDQTLISEAIKGHKEALELLIKKHQPYIYNVAWKMVQNPVEAQDLTQEVLIKVITKLSQYEGRSRFRTWLYRIVMNHFLQMKKQQKEIAINEDFEVFAHRLDALPDKELSDLEQEEFKEEIREMNIGCMAGMLLCLTREQRLVYIIGELFDADHNLGAELLNISKGNFRVRLTRARKDLFHFMNNQCGLVNKDNPCRCRKKITAVMECGVIDSKNLLFNKEEFGKFQKFISKDADDMLTIVEEKYRELHHELPYKQDFDKKVFIDDFLRDDRVTRLLNL